MQSNVWPPLDSIVPDKLSEELWLARWPIFVNQSELSKFRISTNFQGHHKVSPYVKIKLVFGEIFALAWCQFMAKMWHEFRISFLLVDFNPPTHHYKHPPTISYCLLRNFLLRNWWVIGLISRSFIWCLYKMVKVGEFNIAIGQFWNEMTDHVISFDLGWPWSTTWWYSRANQKQPLKPTKTLHLQSILACFIIFMTS